MIPIVGRQSHGWSRGRLLSKQGQLEKERHWDPMQSTEMGLIVDSILAAFSYKKVIVLPELKCFPRFAI